jgi:hypothetical protein
MVFPSALTIFFRDYTERDVKTYAPYMVQRKHFDQTFSKSLCAAEGARFDQTFLKFDGASP